MVSIRATISEHEIIQ